MQKLNWTNVAVQGPRHCEEMLLQPAAVQGFYRDIKVLAYPAGCPGAVLESDSIGSNH